MNFVGRRLRRMAFFIVFVILSLFALQYILYVEVYPYSFDASVKKYSNENSVEDFLILSVIKAESKFNKNAKSNKNAYGLMQITEATAREIAEQLDIKNFDTNMLYESDVNIRMGSYYLSTLISEFYSIETALAAYNSGPGNVKRWLEDNEYSKDNVTLYNIPFKETDKYVKKVRVNYNVYNFLYRELPSYIPEGLLIFKNN